MFPPHWQSAVLGLQSKVALLDGAHVGAITGQLNELLTTLQKVSDNKNKEIDTEHKTKVTEALETVTTIAPLISVVPDVVSHVIITCLSHDYVLLVYR